MQHHEKYQTILGVKFFAGTLDEALEKARRGGLIVVPAAPGMILLPVDSEYRESLMKADMAITDSGFMVLVWYMLTGRWLPRLSGLRFLGNLLKTPWFLSEENSFWIMPSESEAGHNKAWLAQHGILLKEENVYVAPVYGKARVEDAHLLAKIQRTRPAHIIVNIGGGTQEKLGYYLRQNLDYNPLILCTGAAIAFMTGLQASIPPWADRLMLGWLLRCLKAPRSAVPRYSRSFHLFRLILRFREKAPILE